MSNTTPKWTKLNDRALIAIEGEGVSEFLQRLITCDCTSLKQDEMAYGALLSPQGKILFDFFLFPTLQGFLIDTAREARDSLIKKLNLYKLRAPLIISANDDIMGFACDSFKVDINVDTHGLKAHRIFQDPRHKDMGCRIYGRALPKISADTAPYLYHKQRISLGLAELGLDYDALSAYPHEVLMDQYQGASNITGHKGCYVGQEVVSRMKHRATVRKRMIKLAGETELPAPATDILADGKKIGIIGSHLNEHGIGLVRLDRLKAAQDNNIPITAGGIVITAQLPDWVDFTLPEGNEKTNGDLDDE